MTVEAAPTVIVARRARAGVDAEFSEWNEELLAAAASFPGHVGSTMQPPDGAHPGEWVTIYRFEHQDDLQRWLDSDARAALLAKGEPMIEGATREQRIAQPDRPATAVTAVMSKRIRPGEEAAYRRAHHDITHAMSRFEGFITSEVSEPVPGVQDDHITVFTFQSRDHLDRWLGSPERQEQLDVIDRLVEGPPVMNVVGGFGGWFATTRDHEPQRWKQAVAVLIALFPTTLTLSLLQRWVAPDVAWVPALFVSNVLGIVVLTWLLMPLVTRALRGWLHPN